MILIRSVVFNILFYLVLLGYFIAALPTFLLPRWGVIAVAKAWGRTNLWLLRVVCGTRVAYRGLEKIPAGSLIVASKHQSLWETFALIPLLHDPAYIYKRELGWIPFFGWYIWKASMIAVDRGARSQALSAMADRARMELSGDRQLIIFPEGTRRAPGAEPSYKFGVVHLYAEIGKPCLPIALNSGLYWPRRKFLRYPGTILLEVLDPIMPGLGKREFAQRLQRDIETATARLIEEGRRELEQAGFAPAA